MCVALRVAVRVWREKCSRPVLAICLATASEPNKRISGASFSHIIPSKTIANQKPLFDSEPPSPFLPSLTQAFYSCL